MLRLLSFAVLLSCTADRPGQSNLAISVEHVGLLPSRQLDHDTTLLMPAELTLLADGTIVIADDAGPTLRYLDPAGSLKRVYGRKGEGPGEIRSIVGLTHSPVDAVVAVSDSRNRRITFFDVDGAVRGEYPVRAGRIGAISIDYQGNVHLDQRGPVSGKRAPNAPTIVVMSPSGDSLHAYGTFTTVDEVLGEHLLNEARFAQAPAGTWILLPYQGKLRFYPAGGAAATDSIVLPPPDGRSADGPFTAPIEGAPNAFAIVRLPVADDIAIHSTGLIVVAARQTPPGKPQRTDLLVYTTEGTLGATIPLPEYARRISISSDRLYALRDSYGGTEVAIDEYSIRLRER